MTPTVVESQDEDAHKAQFSRAMTFAAERAWAGGAADEALAAMHDVLEGIPQPENGADALPTDSTHHD